MSDVDPEVRQHALVQALRTARAHKLPNGRLSFRLEDGREIYQWEQTLDDVLVYIRPPPGVAARMISCQITPTRVTLGIQGNPPFMDEELEDICVSKDSFWTLVPYEDLSKDEKDAAPNCPSLELTFTKANKGSTWKCVFKGHAALDENELTDTKKKILLERFQEEHPGFDFRDAAINGEVPDPRTFMGGIRHK